MHLAAGTLAFCAAFKCRCHTFFPWNIAAEAGNIAASWSRVRADFTRENRDLASDFASLQFSKRPSENTKRREVAAHKCFDLAGPTGLEPATSGVTGRRSNQLNYDPAS